MVITRRREGGENFKYLQSREHIYKINATDVKIATENEANETKVIRLTSELQIIVFLSQKFQNYLTI